VTDFTKAVALDKGKEISLTWIDPKSQIAVTKLVTPRANPPKGQGALGVSLYGMSSVTLSYDTPIQKVLSGIIHPLNLLSYNFDVMGKLIASSIKEKDATAISQGVAGPVGIFSLVGTIVQIPDIKERLMQILNLAGILSISLAFFNVLPIPALDGGRLFFILFEGVTGKKMDPNREALAHTIGMVVLLALILLVTFKDIFQFLL
jgi:regulator of sigma E protease